MPILGSFALIITNFFDNKVATCAIAAPSISQTITFLISFFILFILSIPETNWSHDTIKPFITPSGRSDNNFLDALKSIEDEEVYIEFGTNISPCLIKSVENNEEYVYMILPIRLKEE